MAAQTKAKSDGDRDVERAINALRHAEEAVIVSKPTAAAAGLLSTNHNYRRQLNAWRYVIEGNPEVIHSITDVDSPRCNRYRDQGPPTARQRGVVPR